MAKLKEEEKPKAKIVGFKVVVVVMVDFGACLGWIWDLGCSNSKRRCC